MIDDNGMFPAELNQWECKVLELEMNRTDFECWYRNPERANQDSLSISYLVEDEYKLLLPDFIFFDRKPDGSVVMDIIDIIGVHLSDALPKLRGLAEYAEQHKQVFRRIESVADPENNK
jgi:type III restriction enzyme